MKKNIIWLIVLMIGALFLTACSNKSALEFKEDYESLNGKENSRGTAYRVVNVPEDNPYEKITTEELLKKIDNKETFYVYFGDKMCPWCRSAIEKSIEVAKDMGVKKIYYIAIWDDEGKEIVRDRYAFEKGKLVKTVEGTDDYFKLLEFFDEYLSDYNVMNDKKESVSTGEKRIYAPNYFYVENGVAKKMVEGTSENQKDPYEELTEELLKDEEKIFKDFFKSAKACTSKSC